MKDPRDVIIEPVVSEKSYALIEQNVYTFLVHPDASQARDPRRRRGHLQREGRQGEHRSTARARRRGSRRSNRIGKQADTKRALVTLAAGERIELFESGI